MKTMIQCFMCAMCASFAMGQIDGDVQLLGQIADGIESNLKKIQSWEGTAAFSSKRTRKKDQILVETQKDETIWFLLSKELDSVHCLRTTIKGTQNIAGSIIELDNHKFRGIVNGSEGYREDFYAEGNPDASIPRRILLIPEKLLIQRIEGQFFNPLEILKQIFRYPHLLESYRMFANHPQTEPYRGTLKIVHEGSLIKVYNSRDDLDLETFYVFDTLSGFNVVEATRKWNQNTRNWKVNYTKFQDVYLPESIKYSHSYEEEPKATFQASVSICTVQFH